MAKTFYIKKLIIQNYATFKNQVINFSPDFNAIVGETGSGKSLVLEALNLILGGRADKKIVRNGAEHSLIETVFHCTDEQVKNFLENEGFPVEEDEIIIKRLIYKNGNSKNYINQLSCNLQLLSNFSKKFVDFVGQFENQKLLSENYQLQLLDSYSGLLQNLKNYKEKFHKFKQLKRDKEELLNSKLMRSQRLDFLNFQIKQIEDLDPSTQDEEDLVKLKESIMNLEKSQKISHQLQELLLGTDNVEGENGIMGKFLLLKHLLQKNLDLFQNISEMSFEIEDKLNNLCLEVSKKLSNDIDPCRLDSTLERLDFYQKLKNKFGGNVESILKTRDEFLAERELIEKAETNLEEIELIIQIEEKSLKALAQDIHLKRSYSAKKFAEKLTQKIRNLKMKGSTIQIKLDELDELTEYGLSKVVFFAETNPGEGFFRIKDIASGGELSRILLALRQISKIEETTNIFLFDEIDTGIGGETATTIGKALSEVAKQGQVIAITHLPQIAQFAQILVLINKNIKSENDKTRTESCAREVEGKLIKEEVRIMALMA